MGEATHIAPGTVVAVTIRDETINTYTDHGIVVRSDLLKDGSQGYLVDLPDSFSIRWFPDIDVKVYTGLYVIIRCAYGEVDELLTSDDDILVLVYGANKS